MQRIIALTGPAGSGKTHASRLLAYDVLEQRGYLMGFAEPLKAAANCLVPGGGAFDESFKMSEVLPGVTGRRVFEAVGTDAMRALCPDWAVLKMRERLERHYPGLEYVVIPDLRFVNEAEFVRGRGGIVVQTMRVAPTSNGGDPNHASQRPLPFTHIDYQLDNSDDDSATIAHWRIILRDRGWL